MYNENKVTLSGNLVRDAESKTVAGDKVVCNFSIAVNTGKEHTSFFDCSAWNQLAEVCIKYLHKGNTVKIEGFLTQQRWKDKEGNNRSKVVIVCNSIDLINEKKESVVTQENNEKQSIFNDKSDDVFSENNNEVPF